MELVSSVCCASYMELDLQSLFGLLLHSCTHWLRLRPRNHSPAFGLIYEDAIRQPRAQDRRHLFVTPWCALKANSEYTYINQSPFNIRSIHGRPVQCCAMLIVLCKEAFLYARYSFLFISNKFSNGIGPETLTIPLYTPLKSPDLSRINSLTHSHLGEGSRMPSWWLLNIKPPICTYDLYVHCA